MSKRSKERKEVYIKAFEINPIAAQDGKYFIFNEEDEKDSLNLIPLVTSIRPKLKTLAVFSDKLFDEELKDLRAFIKTQIGKNNFKKLTKVFAK